MEKNKSNKDFLDGLTPDIIEGYLNGTLSADMKRSVDKYLSEHPFEAEALEGLQSHSMDLKGEIADLEQRLTARVYSQSHQSSRYFWPAAAVVSLLLVSGLVIYLLLPGQQPSTPIAVNKETPISEKRDAVKTTTPEPAVQSENGKPEAGDDDTTTDDILPQQDTEITRQPVVTITDASEFKNEELNLTAVEKEDKIEPNEGAASKEALEETIIEDIVFEEAPVTEPTANFKRSTSNRKSAPQVSTPAAAQEPEQAIDLPTAQPPSNWSEYLSRQLRYPEDARSNNIEGKVKVRFQVNTDGSLTAFELIRELGFGCDQEAIRVLRDGPPWKPAQLNGSPIISQGEVEINFPPEI